MRPGKLVAFWRRTGPEQLVWAGFARVESLSWWKHKGGELVDVPASRFAERSQRDRQLHWDAVPAGLVVRGLVDPNAGKPLLKIVTRTSTLDELQRFEHPRMPQIESPLFSAAPLEVTAPIDPQGQLF